LGYIEGGSKKEEVVMIGAHFDHVGFGEYGSNNGAEGRGKIHHGADDNASGTCAVLEVAEALGELNRRGVKPQRSVIVCFWGAEELGLIGSKHFVNNLPANLKLENIAAYINLDMVGRNADKLLTINGVSPDPARKSDCPEVYELTKKLNEKHSLGFNFDFKDQTPGTDSWSFYQIDPPDGKKIVSFAYFTGFHADYHRFSDTWEKINYPKLTRVTKLAFLTLWEISEMKEKPRYKN
jgi:Zn-dependent M28 family amino/carboxypeptidase